jgi:formylglycine-generating enzyme required for sulfatase activity
MPTEDFKDVFNYIFFDKNSKTGKTSLYIFPDTACWTNDFTYSYNEPMTNMYFWHPAYDGYPVTGVSWYQAMAFLDWKTHMHQAQLDAEKIPYEIEYTLPSDIEWELASVSIELGKNVAFHSYYECTQDWLTNLGISYPGHDDPYQRPNYLKNLFTKDQYFRGDYIVDSYFHTGPADLSALKKSASPNPLKHIDPMGISWMDGNVSEWMIESYAENWKPFFQKHLAVLDADTSESTKLAKQIEMLYDKGNAANGRLVRGANWYDERFSGRPTSLRNDAGINPKRYVDPSEQHSTIGFRYVVHVKRK